MDPFTSPASLSPEGRRLAELQAFYRWHAGIYDWTRPCLLFGRRAAAAALGGGPGELVLDVGCGTGANLPSLATEGASVVGIECTDAMRRRAEARIRRCRLEGRVILDRRPYGDHSAYEGRADRILFSYSLSMIPSFPQVLARARQDLRPAGRLAVVDFLDARAPVAALLQRSHVDLGPNRLNALATLFPRHTRRIVNLGLWRYFLFFGS